MCVCALLACETPRPTNDVFVLDVADSGITVDQLSLDMPTEDSLQTANESGSRTDVLEQDVAMDVASDVPTAPACMPRATDFQPRSMAARPAYKRDYI